MSLAIPSEVYRSCEVTIMLLVLMLTSVLAPAIFDYVKDAQWVKVKEDCEAIAVSVAVWSATSARAKLPTFGSQAAASGAAS